QKDPVSDSNPVSQSLYHPTSSVSRRS
nr:hypothetical protein [Tanacetum cinerariifolium]